MAGRLEGKVAIVTGASRGIGRETALLFAREGAKVCVNYSVSAGQAQEVVERINRSAGEAVAIKADVADSTQVEAMAEEVTKRFGTVDILVNNAGMVRPSDIFSMRSEDLDQMFGVNVKGTIYCIRSIMNAMIRKKSGKIVNISSIAALGTAFSGTTAYASTKAAVFILTKRFALELGKYGINVNCVAPGFIHTEMAQGALSAKEFDELAQTVRDRSILARIGKPLDIANAVLFFASEESSFATGQILVVDGGRMDYLSHSL